MIPTSSFADSVAAGWSMGLSCPPKGPNGSGSMLASNAGGFGGAGSCERVPGLFSRLTFSTHGGGTLRSSSAVALQTPSVLITPPLLTTESQPIFTVANACPVALGTLNLNWLFVQWTDAERLALANTYLFGTATYSSGSGVRITGQYDIDGSVYSLASHPMPGTCTDGVYPVSSSVYSDINGSIFFNAAGMGAFKTQAGRATFFFPRFTITAATHFGSKSFRGLSFDADGANGAGDVRHIKASADAAGTVFTVQALSDPQDATVDSGGTAYTDTLTFAGGNINSPHPGMLFGTVTRTGSGAGSGNVACIANAADGDVLLLCSGQSPSDNLLPFHFSLYAENQHNQARGGWGGTIAYDAASGKLYAMETVEGSSGTGIVRLNADGTVDSTFDSGAGFNGGVFSLVFDAALGKLYAAGSFTAYDGTGRNGIVRLNGDGSVDTGFAPGSGFDSAVWDIALDTSSGKLVAVGQFTNYNGTGRTRVARLNADGSVDTGFAPGTGFNSLPTELAVDSATGKVYVGGSFTTFNGTGRVCIARLNADGSLDTGFTVGTGFNNPVQSLAFDSSSGKVYVGGAFSLYNGTGRNGIARLNSNGSLDTGFDPGSGFNNYVTALSLDTLSGKPYAGGDFTTFNGTGRNRIARLNTNGSLDTGFDPSTGFDGIVNGIAVDAALGKLSITGGFTAYRGAGRNGIARVNADGTVDSVLDPASAFNSYVYALALDTASGNLHVGGNFTAFNGTARNYIARLNAEGALDTGFDPGTGFDNSVAALAFDSSSGKLYAGGSFTTFNGTGRNRIVRLNTDGSLDTSFDPGTGFDDQVYSLALDATSGKIYVGGWFTTFNGTGRNRIARLNTDGSLDTSFNPGSGFDALVESVAFDASSQKLYAGGYFSTFNGTGRNGVARLNADGSLDTGFVPGSGFNGEVKALLLDGTAGKLYAGGDFTTFDGTGRNNIARLNTDGSLDTAFAPSSGASSVVWALALDGSSGKVYAGGQLLSFNGVARGRIARVNSDGSLDTGFVTGSGFNSWVYAIVPDPSSGKLSVGSAAWSYGTSSIGYLVRLTYSGALD